MTNYQFLSGVYAAALTPLQQDASLALDELPGFLSFLVKRGCHGALLMGTTGEGPSFSPAERLQVFRTALHIREDYPGFRLLAGTGTPSLEETIELTRAALELGCDAAVVLPPYYYRNASDDGLFAWFSQVIQRAVPTGKHLLGYHIPPMTGVPLSLDLLARLKDAFPEKFAGIKDSSGDPDHARALGQRFGADLLVLNGNDSIYPLALHNHGGGCITAMANVRSQDLRLVWDAQILGNRNQAAEARLDKARQILAKYPPNPPLYKALLARLHSFPLWNVRPPLLSMPPESLEAALQEVCQAVPEFSK